MVSPASLLLPLHLVILRIKSLVPAPEQEEVAVTFRKEEFTVGGMECCKSMGIIIRDPVTLFVHKQAGQARTTIPKMGVGRYDPVNGVKIIFWFFEAFDFPYVVKKNV